METPGHRGLTASRVVSVVVVDEHLLVRQGLRALLEREPDLRVHSEFEKLADAVKTSVRGADIVLTSNPDALEGGEALRQAVDALAPAKVLVLEASYDAAAVHSALRAGARGFLAKTDPAPELIGAVRSVASTGTYVNPRAAVVLMAKLQGGVRPADALPALSPRETQVLRLLADGMTAKQVAAALDVGNETVRGYRRSLMRKLGVNNLAAMTRMAIRAGLAGKLRQ